MLTPAKPSLWNLALELRAGVEWSAHWLARTTFSHWPRSTPGIPVLVLPGLATNDLAMLPMRQALAKLGYCAYPWGMGWNTGPTARQLSALATRVRQLANTHGQPVALVGWSLGGSMARAVAARCPAQVRCVVAMGSPLSPQVGTHLEQVFRVLSGRHADDPQLWEWMQRPMGRVPMSSIASIDDGLLHHAGSTLPAAKRQETILVRGVSHLGIPAHPFMLWLVHHRLMQGKRWKPYAPGQAWEQIFLPRVHGIMGT